jgi:hypothetical protein
VMFAALVLTGPFVGTSGPICTLSVALELCRGRLLNAFELFWTAMLVGWWASIAWALRRPMTFRPALVLGERSSDAEAGVFFYKRLALAFCLLSFSLGLLISIMISRSPPLLN